MSRHPSKIVGVEHAVAGYSEIRTDDIRDKIGPAAFFLYAKLHKIRNRQGVTRATVEELSKLQGFEVQRYEHTKKLLRRLEACGLVERGRRKAYGPNRFYTERHVRGHLQRGWTTMSVPAGVKTWMTSAPKAGSGGFRGKRPHEEVKMVAQPTATPVVVETMTETSASLSGPVRVTPRIPVDLPVRPSPGVIGTAMVPNPPKIKQSDPEAYKVKLLTDAFRGAVEQTYGSPCWLYRNMTPRAKSWKTFAKAATLLMQFDISPAAWCAFAVRRWYRARTHEASYVEGADVQLPPIYVILAEKTIVKQLADEDRRGVVEECALGGRVVHPKETLTLIKRYNAMVDATYAGMTGAQAAAKFFPGSSYDEMTDAAKVATTDARLAIEAEIARGRFVW